METAWFANGIAVAVGGSLGSLARLGVTSGIHAALGPKWGALWPWGTLTVNLLGCLGFGVAYSLLRINFAHSSALRFVILTGFFGGFTTFSAFAFEIQQVNTRLGTGWSLFYASSHVALGWAAIVAGLYWGGMSR
jgi:CrcB protein